MAESSARKHVSLFVDYAPARGKKVICKGNCGSEIGRGDLRIREEGHGSEASYKYHLECYPYTFDTFNIFGVDKLKPEDREKVLWKSTHTQEQHKPIPSFSRVSQLKKKVVVGDPISSDEKVLPIQTSSSSSSSSSSHSPPPSSSSSPSPPSSSFHIGSKVMAKVQCNQVGKNVWFPAKIVKMKASPWIPDLQEFYVCYDDDNFKEWVPQNCVAPPLTEEGPPITKFKTGMQALGFRRKPSSVSSATTTGGWWYSVKVLKYLADVPGAFVQWLDFPFPDSILEAGQIQAIDYESMKETNASDTQKGTKRSLEDRESEPKLCKFIKTVAEEDDDNAQLSAA